MSVNGKARKATTLEDVIMQMKSEIALLKSLIRDRDGISASETKPIGTAGGVTGPGTAGFLKTEGDTMVGPIAYFPKLLTRDATDDSLNVGSELGSGYSSRGVVAVGPSQEDIATIHGAAFAGQILMLQGVLTESFVIKHGTGNIRTFDGGDLVVSDNQNVWLVFDSIANEWAAIGASGGSGTGTYIAASLSADQIANLAVGDHVEFDTIEEADGIVLQTGAGQLDGIFELEAGKTYYLSAGVAPFFGATNHVEFVWYDITNAAELGVRAIQDDAVLALDQHKGEIIYTPSTNVTVELRLVANTTPANLNGYDSDHTFANIFEFSGKNGADGTPGVAGSKNWLDSVRAKTLVDVPALAAFTVLTDGVTLVEDDRVLLTEQATASENGIYDVGVVAAGLAPLTRSVDLDDSVELVASLLVMVEEGTDFKNTMWQLISNNPLTIGVTDQLWEQFVSAGTGLAIPGAAGADGKDASGQFIGDGRQFHFEDYISRLQGFRNVRGPQGALGDFFLIPNDGYDHGDFGGTPPPPAENNPQEVLVTVGGRGGHLNADATSSYSLNYGESWVEVNDLTDEPWRHLCYDPTGRILLCISTSTTASRNVGISTDKGQTWGSSLAITPGFTGLVDMIWSEANSLFIVVDNSITGNAIHTSPDGTTWTNRTTPNLTPIAPAVAANLSNIVEAPGLGKIFCFGDQASDFIESTDGITWTAVNYVDVLGNADPGFEFADGITGVTWSEGQQKLLARSSGVQLKTAGLYESLDGGLNWTNTPAIPDYQGSTFGPTDLIWIPRYSVWILSGGLTGTSAAPWAYSFDGDNWKRAPPKEFRAHETDYDESFLAQPGGGQYIVFSPSFGYVFGFGGGLNLTTDDFRNNSFTRTNVYMNDQNSQSGMNYPNIRERDFGSPR